MIVLPSTDKWMDSLIPYTKSTSMFVCPVVPKGEYGYAFEDSLNRKKTMDIGSPNLTPMIFESTDTNYNAHGTLMYLFPDPPRHIGNSVGYADGHAKSFKRGMQP